jgi:hypothetical protein
MPRTKGTAKVATDDKEMKRLVMPISDALHHRIRVLAVSERLTMAEIVRELLDDAVNRRETQRRGRAAPAALYTAPRRVA